MSSVTVPTFRVAKGRRDYRVLKNHMKQLRDVLGEKYGNFEENNDDTEQKSFNLEIDNKYITIYHGLGIKFNLSVLENALVSMIIRLSKKTDWCYLGKKKFALYLNTSEQTIRDRTNELKRRGLIQENTERSWLKTSMLRASHEVKDSYWYYKKLADEVKTTPKDSLGNN